MCLPNEQVRDELARLRRDYRTLVDNAPDVLARFDRQGRFLYINDTAERNTGIPAAAFLGKTFRELGALPEENILQWEQAPARAFTPAPRDAPKGLYDGGDAWARHEDDARHH